MLHQALHRQIHTSVSFLLNLSVLMPYNPRSEGQCIGPRCRGTKALLLLEARRAGGCIWRWSEGHISVRKHDSSAGRSPNPLFQRLSSMSLNYVRHLPQQPRVFLGVCVSPGPHLTSLEKIHHERRGTPALLRGRREFLVLERELSLNLDATLDDSKTRWSRSLVDWAKTAQYLEPGNHRAPPVIQQGHT